MILIHTFVNFRKIHVHGFEFQPMLGGYLLPLGSCPRVKIHGLDPILTNKEYYWVKGKGYKNQISPKS